jgi:hypothetical protein
MVLQLPMEGTMSIDITESANAQAALEVAEIRKAEAVTEFIELIKIPAFALIATSSVLVPVWILTNLL